MRRNLMETLLLFKLSSPRIGELLHWSLRSGGFEVKKPNAGQSSNCQSSKGTGRKLNNRFPKLNLEFFYDTDLILFSENY